MELCLFVQITAELIPIDQKFDQGEVSTHHRRHMVFAIPA